MVDILITVGVAVAALIAGHLLTRWWERARPLVVLTRFSGVTKGTEPAQCDRELHELTNQSFAMQVISEGEVQYAEIDRAHRAAKRDIELKDNIDTWVADTVKSLGDASNDQEKTAAIKSLFRWTGLRSFTEFLFYRQLCNDLTLKDTHEEEPKLLVSPTDEREGSLLVVFPDALGNLGQGFKRETWKEKAIRPLAQAIAHLDTEFLARALKRIPDLAVQQRDVNRQIIEKTTPIREDHTQWAAECTVVNYGSSPLILWPSTHLLLREIRGPNKLKIPCYLAQENEDANDAIDLTGPVVVTPGQTIRVWAITKETKRTMDDGNLVDAYIKDKTARGRIRLSITQRGIPFKTSCRSTHLVFAEED